VAALQQVTRGVPIVFTSVTNPVGAGLVDSLARPGGNTTGFMLFEYSSSGKWLELLKQVAPGVTRAAVLREAANPAGSAQFGVIQAMAPSLGVEVSPINVRDPSEIERAIAAFARSANGGLIVTGSATASLHRELIISLAAQHKLPAVYSNRFPILRGGLISYGIDLLDQFRRAAGHIDRILKGEKPADLPVQAPTTYELVINLKTAKTLGLTVPATLLATAVTSGFDPKQASRWRSICTATKTAGRPLLDHLVGAAALAAASPQLTDIRRGRRQCDAGAGPAPHEAVEEYHGPRWWDGEHGFWGLDLSTRHPPPH
jgi:ABC-type uncharacterized transport system substrate-binding protein